MKRFLMCVKSGLIPVAFVGALAGVGTADTAVTTGLTTLADNAIATMGAVAPIAIGIFGVFLIWKYGKKIFKGVGNG